MIRSLPEHDPRLGLIPHPFAPRPQPISNADLESAYTDVKRAAEEAGVLLELREQPYVPRLLGFTVAHGAARMLMTDAGVDLAARTLPCGAWSVIAAVVMKVVQDLGSISGIMHRVSVK